jgi:hypothetical protein
VIDIKARHVAMAGGIATLPPALLRRLLMMNPILHTGIISLVRFDNLASSGITSFMIRPTLAIGNGPFWHMAS